MYANSDDPLRCCLNIYVPTHLPEDVKYACEKVLDSRTISGPCHWLAVALPLRVLTPNVYLTTSNSTTPAQQAY